MVFKFLIISVLTITHFTQVSAQTNCSGENIKSLKTIVEKSISIKAEDYKNKIAEFYMIEMEINDSTGCIGKIDYFKKASSKNSNHIEKAIADIRAGWKPLNCRIKKLLIPIFIFFEDSEEYDYPDLLKSNPDMGLFVSKTIYISIDSKHQ